MRIPVLAISAAFVIVLWTVPAMCQTAHSHGHVQTTDPEKQNANGFSRLMTAAMDKMHEDMAAAPQTGDTDRDFLAMMIPHHAGAVEMARLVLVYGKDPLVRQLAEEIIAGQQAEIGAMQARLEILKAGADPRPSGFPALTGHRGE